jgi:hypothetical protein
VAFDFDQELQTAIAAAASLYGSRDARFTLLPVTYHQKKYAQSIVDEMACTVSVKLVDPMRLIPIPLTQADKDSEAKYELWHEAVHCLAPVQRMDTSWFEEGVALRFSLTHAPLTAAQKRCNRGALGHPWNLVLHAFERLNPSDDQIKAIRERADFKSLDTVKEDLIIQICGADPRLARKLCRRLPGDSR